MLVAFVVTRLLILGVGYAVFYSFYPGAPPAPPGYEPGQGFLSWSPWCLLAYYDTTNYMQIANNGYTLRLTTFFPLYPLLIRLFGGTLPSAILISNISLLMFLFVLNRLWGRRGVLAGCAAPAGFFFASGYGDSLFLLLSSLCLLLIREEKWFGGALFAGLAALSRSFGWPLVLVYCLFNLLKARGKKRIYCLLAVGLMSLFPVYLMVSFGDPLAFVHNQHFYNKAGGLPLQGMFLDARYLLSGRPDPGWLVMAAVNYFGVFFFLLSLIREFRFEPTWLYGLLYFLVMSLVGAADYTAIPNAHALFRYSFGCVLVYRTISSNTTLLGISLCMEVLAAAMLAQKWFIS